MSNRNKQSIWHVFLYFHISWNELGRTITFSYCYCLTMLYVWHWYCVMMVVVRCRFRWLIFARSVWAFIYFPFSSIFAICSISLCHKYFVSDFRFGCKQPNISRNVGDLIFIQLVWFLYILVFCIYIQIVTLMINITDTMCQITWVCLVWCRFYFYFILQLFPLSFSFPFSLLFLFYNNMGALCSKLKINTNIYHSK